MDFCDIRCCFGQEPCKFFGTNAINIAGNHKVCNLHLNSITFLQSLHCPYCDSFCKITLDCIPPSLCPTCHEIKSEDQIQKKKCGHLHCDQCFKNCENLASLENPQKFNQPVLAQTSNKSISDLRVNPNLSSTNSSQNFYSLKPNMGNFSEGSISTLKICPNCGDKMQEIKQKCGHTGCLGCYNHKPCIFCKLDVQREVNKTACKNCGKFSKEVRLKCGHDGCDSCVFISDCRNCEKVKKKKCENCGEFDDIIPFECQHNGCLKCCNKPCKICYASGGNYNLNRQSYHGQLIYCQSCSMNKKLIKLNCGHYECETCWNIIRCRVCVNNKCQNCLANFPYYEWKGCIHKLCLKCSQSEEKCKRCYKNCQYCHKFKNLQQFKLDPKFCNDCFKRVSSTSSNCSFCNYNRVSPASKLQGKTICDYCTEYLFNLNPPPGNNVCKYCGEIRGLKKFNCGHECCPQCWKNSECYTCLIDVKKLKESFHLGNCINCKKSTKKYLKLLCDHDICNKCYNKEYIHLDYRCRWCALSRKDIKCIRCRKLTAWENLGDISKKKCCFIDVCNKCGELSTQNHSCNKSSIIDCLIF